MTYEPKPIERLYLWRLAAGGGGDWKKEIKPDIDAAARGRLIKAGLIEQEKRKPIGGKLAILHLSLTDAGWAWLSEQKENEFSSRANSAETLRKILSRIHAYLGASNVSLAELLRPRESTAPASPPPLQQEPDLRGRIESAYMDLSGGQVNVRVRLAALRAKLADVPRDRLDAALLSLALDGKASLYRLDDPREIGPEDREAVWRTPAGDDCHIIYLGGRST
jgi:hypothetical protein